MNEQIKTQIAQEVARLAERTSQNKTATKAGVSSATISQILNNKWDLIANEMWRKIQTNLNINLGWIIAPTRNLVGITSLLKAAQSRHLAISIAYEAGAGKSVAYRNYVNTSNNVIYIECKNSWSKRSYIIELNRACGMRPSGTSEEMIAQFTNHVAKLQSPLIIIDQFDKLKDSSLDLFMDFYNDLEDHCGFVISGVPALEKRILRGVQHDKVGYRELYSRIGRKFIKLEDLSKQDVTSICNANGITDSETILYIFKNSEGDIRRVRRDVERIHLNNTVEQ